MISYLGGYDMGNELIVVSWVCEKSLAHGTVTDFNTCIWIAWK